MYKKSSGQALVSLLLFTVIASLIITAAAIVIVINMKSTNRLTQSNVSRTIAESGIENALLRLLRNPSYTGEVISLNGGTATVQVTGSSSAYMIKSTGINGNFIHTITVTTQTTNGILSVSSWSE
jgi:type II secretory pathway component PulK